LVVAAGQRAAGVAGGWQVQASAAEALRLRVCDEARLLGRIISQRGIRAE
jgi:hypothetical protein